MARGGGLRLAEPCGDAGASRPRWTRWRRASQLLFVAFFVLLPVSARWWGQTVVLGTLASLHIGPLALVDPAAGLASILASRSVQLSLLGGMVLPALLALVLGPVFCSWVCPWGLISELLDKLPGRRPRAGARPAGRRRWLWLGGLMLASALLGLPLAALISAPRLITQLPLELIYLGGASVGTVSWLVVLGVLEIVLPRRSWCRWLCPVGSVLVLIRLPWTLTVGWHANTCQPGLKGTNCVKVCSWRLDPRHLRAYDGCTNCGACIEGCPTTPGSLCFGRRRGGR